MHKPSAGHYGDDMPLRYSRNLQGCSEYKNLDSQLNNGHQLEQQDLQQNAVCECEKQTQFDEHSQGQPL